MLAFLQLFIAYASFWESVKNISLNAQIRAIQKENRIDRLCSTRFFIHFSWFK